MRLSLFIIYFVIMGIFPAHARTSDYFGRNLSLPLKPQRIISLSPATTEMLYALNAENLLVGVTLDCNYPKEAQSKKKVGRFGSIHLESLLKLKPDLLIATQDMGKALLPLKRLNIPLVTFASPSIHVVLNNVSDLGSLINKASQGKRLKDSMLKQLIGFGQAESISNSGFYFLWQQPLITSAKNSFIGDILSYSGINNIVGEQKKAFVHYSLERLLKQDPDVIIVPASVSHKINWNKGVFKRLKAVRKHHIIVIDDDLMSRPGPRVIEAIQVLKRALKKLN